MPPEADKPLPEADKHLEGWKPRTTRPTVPLRLPPTIEKIIGGGGEPPEPPEKEPPRDEPPEPPPPPPFTRKPFKRVEEANQAVIALQKAIKDLCYQLFSQHRPPDDDYDRADEDDWETGLIDKADKHASEIINRCASCRIEIDRLREHLT